MDILAKTKEKLIIRIKDSTNLDLLQTVEKLFSIEDKDKDFYQLNRQQEEAVAESREQYKKDEFITNEDAISNLKKWLKNK